MLPLFSRKTPCQKASTGTHYGVAARGRVPFSGEGNLVKIHDYVKNSIISTIMTHCLPFDVTGALNELIRSECAVQRSVSPNIFLKIEILRSDIFRILSIIYLRRTHAY